MVSGFWVPDSIVALELDPVGWSFRNCSSYLHRRTRRHPQQECSELSPNEELPGSSSISIGAE